MVNKKESKEKEIKQMGDKIKELNKITGEDRQK